jgi:hypothetical protein
MENSEGLALVYTGGDVNIQRIKAELEIQGINSIIEDGFKQGVGAGFGGGVPSAIDLYVAETDVEKAKEIIKAIML